MAVSNNFDFEEIYDAYALALYKYVFDKVGSREISEEIIQDIFLELWQNKNHISIEKSIKAYLFGAAKNKVLNYFRSENVRKKYAMEFALFAASRVDNSTEESFALAELQRKIDKHLAELPSKCQVVFKLSRKENHTINQIADQLNISTHTVENYISQALHHLRTSLAQYLPL